MRARNRGDLVISAVGKSDGRLRAAVEGSSSEAVGWGLPLDAAASRVGDRERVLRAIAASPGIAIGRAVRFVPESVAATEAEPQSEWERYRAAIELLRQEWLHAHRVAAVEAPGIVAIVESYLRLLEDAELENQVQSLLRAGVPVEQAVQQVFEPVVSRLRHSPDALLRERGSELEQFVQRLLSALRRQRVDYSRVAGAVVVAPAVTPSEVILLHQAGACGLVTAVGGIASHTTILARSLQLPAVIGVRGTLSDIPEGELVVVDGYTGVVIVHPAPETCRRYKRHRDSTEWRRRIVLRFAAVPARTVDGKTVVLRANIATPRDVEEALLVGAEGAGLVRTEALLLQLGRFPTEEEQVRWYRELAERFYPHPVTIRLFDVGGDTYAVSAERNPALGMRGVRFLLAHPEIAQTQIRAILRAAELRTMRLLIPMVTRVEEVEQIRALVAESAQALGLSNRNGASELPIGVMVETPAAALIADQLAQRADFFSIGTNDLTQYVLAVDRENAQLAELFDPFHQAVWRLIAQAVEAGHRRGIPVGICGELAAHAAATELLVGVDIDELSTIPAAVISLKHRIRRLSFQRCRRQVEEFLGADVFTR